LLVSFHALAADELIHQAPHPTQEQHAIGLVEIDDLHIAAM